jgi:hypothetical protein
LCLSASSLAILAHPFAAVAPAYAALPPFFRLDYVEERIRKETAFDEERSIGIFGRDT